MSIVRWEPFGEMDSLFNRLMPSMFGRWPGRLGTSNGDTVEWAPSANISETDKEYLIRAELPAVKKEDVKVTVGDGMITIEGERKQQKEDQTARARPPGEALSDRHPPSTYAEKRDVCHRLLV